MVGVGYKIIFKAINCQLCNLLGLTIQCLLRHFKFRGLYVVSMCYFSFLNIIKLASFCSFPFFNMMSIKCFLLNLLTCRFLSNYWGWMLNTLILIVVWYALFLWRSNQQIKEFVNKRRSLQYFSCGLWLGSHSY